MAAVKGRFSRSGYAVTEALVAWLGYDINPLSCSLRGTAAINTME
jgi:hypothetical protein